MIRVELIRAWPGRHEALQLELPEGSRAGDALARAGWALDAGHPLLAVYGQRATPETVLRDGDRLELLRPLQADPKQARRRRAQRQPRR
ncbi:RnfH family protein [Thermomonas flagellata]|uniref:RnfH family protein n=1 Tax=Thermomonas flagellata TaxID=2888524 RepID=UPI001F036D80|nr:RnfH family protein [Thermomonas flagellata]